MRNIKVLVMDVDGTMTDGKVYIGAGGEICKTFNIKDGYAIYKMLPDYGIVPVVITGRSSRIVKYRCEELGIKEIYQGINDKKSVVLELAVKYGLNVLDNGKVSGVAYIGDDLIDIPAMEVCEISGCPNDAVDEVKKVAVYICMNNGGKGAIREFIEWMFKRENSND